VKLMVLPGRTSALASLFYEGATLSESVEWLRQLDYRSRENRILERKLMDHALALLKSDLLPESVTIDRVDSDGLWLNAMGVTLPATELSDGYRTVAAFALDLARLLVNAYGDLDVDDADTGIVILNPGVVLIDEIDAHLHPSWQQWIGPWLKAHFPNVQFIVSTHSPFVCQAADEGGLVKMPAPGSHAAPTIVDGLLFYRVTNGSVDQALLSDLFGLDHTYSAESADKRGTLAELERLALRGQLSHEDKERFQQLRFELLDPFPEEVESEASLFGIAEK
jgi:hypothetical protein